MPTPIEDFTRKSTHTDTQFISIKNKLIAVGIQLPKPDDILTYGDAINSIGSENIPTGTILTKPSTIKFTKGEWCSLSGTNPNETIVSYNGTNIGLILSSDGKTATAVFL